MVRDIIIASLSSGTLGEPFARHELQRGLARLAQRGLNVRFTDHALCGCGYLRAHPEARAADLLQAFADPAAQMILCAIGGDDTYRLLPYLFGRGELQRAVRKKIFLGFSDTTVNHLMLHKVGLPTFYGQAFLPDVCELDRGMLPYTQRYFDELLRTGTIREVRPSPVWYDSRSDFSPSALDTAMPAHPDRGFVLLQGAPRFSGPILGGCIDTLYDLFNSDRYADSAALCQKYMLFPTPDDWHGRILLLESSEEQPPPHKYRRMLAALREAGVFSAVAGILVGKPMDEKYAAEYQSLLLEAVGDPSLPILYNVNVGHATPRCILPFGVPAQVDAAAQRITFAPA